ncbi:g6611 [Coccomyxa viridis]|uniref:G6611 protein n=1 Tax=Coccomyxa viridis TaxID=1274662 RepID=A0ABP1FVT4_9CHLO
MSASSPAQAQNLVNGEWHNTKGSRDIPDPMNGEAFIKLPDPQIDEIQPYVESLRSVPKSGMHNPLKNPERYNMYGDISMRAAEEMRKKEVEDFFTHLLQRVVPKHDTQARAEVTVTRRFLENFSADQPRFMARSFGVSGDHAGQMSHGMRWPWGPVGLVTPFNFPLEIPALQLMGALFMGNKPLVHVDHRVSIVAEQFIRMLHHVGMPKTDLDYIQGNGKVVGEILKQGHPRSTLFTGSQKVAEQLAVDLKGKVYLEDAGFDWKILGPDVMDFDYVAWQCDQDAYAATGQKCSAQSILFQHSNWVSKGLEKKLADIASKRSMDNLTVGPVLTWSTEAMLGHVDKLLKIPGARLAFGGKPLKGHSIPKQYGAIEPTAVFVPLQEILKDGNFEMVTTEVFGPVQVITEYSDEQLSMVLEATEKLEAHLTAAVVSNDAQFTQKVLANTVNGTTYAGIRARTTGAPQNHWFGPAGDPRSAGIGTPEAIRLVWSCHREIINDVGPVPSGFNGVTT